MEYVTKDNFIITETKSGHTVEWKHNNKSIESFRLGDTNKRAKSFIHFLVEWFKVNDFYYVDGKIKLLAEDWQSSICYTCKVGHKLPDKIECTDGKIASKYGKRCRFYRGE
jgi:hypothetical protein